MKLRHTHAILFSGFLWLGVGILLLTKGLKHVFLAGKQVLEGSHEGFSLLLMLGRFIDNPQRAVGVLLGCALLIGLFKGRVVLKKTVNRVVSRIRSHPSPIKFNQMYSLSYLIILGSMMLLGMLFKVLPLPLDVKGFIDVAIGMALINGALLYLRAAYSPEFRKSQE